MNTLINQYLQVLDFYVHFDLDEEFNETIESSKEMILHTNHFQRVKNKE